MGGSTRGDGGNRCVKDRSEPGNRNWIHEAHSAKGLRVYPSDPPAQPVSLLMILGFKVLGFKHWGLGYSGRYPCTCFA